MSAHRRPSFWQDLGWRLEALAYDGFVGLMRALPIDTASDLGGWLFRTLGPLTSTQKTVRANIDIAFPDMPEAEKQALITRQWENTGRTTAEFPLIDKMGMDSGRVEIIGFDRLKAIAENGKPVVIISAHQSNWELTGVPLFALGIIFQITYRAANNPYVDARIKEGRRRFGARLFAPKGGDGAKELLLAMQKGESAFLMNDQKFNRGVPTPFFGHLVDTAPGPTRLAQKFGTYLQPITVRRLKKARFQVIAHPPIEVASTGHKGEDIETTVCKITEWVEGVVRDDPADWFWVHKRWRNETYQALKAGQAAHPTAQPSD